MAFPTTGILDNFAAGGNWTFSVWQSGTYTITAGQLQQNGAQNVYSDGRLDLSGSYGPDVEAYVTCVELSAVNNDELYIGCRLASDLLTGYWLRIAVNTGGDETWDFRKSSGLTIVGANFTQAVANGDAIGIEVTGTGATVTLKAYHKPAAGSWSLVATRTDSSSPITSAGYLALISEQGTGTITFDDFGGGTVVAAGGFVPYPNPRYAMTGGAQPGGGGIS